jgi:uncharacterized phage-like protein YoqJ
MFDPLPPAFTVTLAGTGHQPNKIAAVEDKVRAATRTRLLMYLPVCVRSGLAWGFDLILAEEALRLHIPVVGVAPYPGQEYGWTDSWKARFRSVLQRCSNVEWVHRKRPHGHREAAEWLNERNHYLIQPAWGVLACWNGDTEGGTWNTVCLARMMQKPLDHIHPYELP